MRDLLLALLLSAPAALANGVSARPGASGAIDATPSTERPNIVLIVTDDQGYADLGCYGARGFETPRLDRLASEGLRFTSFYVSQATCTSSRASIVTGCYANRIGVTGALMPWQTIGLHPDEETLAELLRTAGYATSFIGKWHLGHLPQHLPTEHGYDEWFGLPYSNDMWPVDFDGRPVPEGHRKRRYPALPLHADGQVLETIDDLAEQGQLTRRYTDRALAFIERHAGVRPFFLHLAHSMPHVPLGVSERWAGSAEYGRYGEVIQEIDAEVGRLLDALEERGIVDRTWVIFTSDNGPWLNFGDHAGLALPLREGKGTMWEGGCRVPCLMRWPGVIEAGRVSDELFATIDLLPTIATACGARLPERPIDGLDLGAHLRDAAAPSARSEYFYYYLNQLCAVRSGQWKLTFPHVYRSYDRTPRGEGGFPGPYERGRVGHALFDLTEDPGERRDVADQHPELVARLMALGERAREELGDAGRRGSGQRQPAKPD